MARAFRWTDTLADRLEVGPVAAGIIANQLGLTAADVTRGALSIRGAYTNPVTDCVMVPRHERSGDLGQLLNDLTYAIGAKPIEDGIVVGYDSAAARIYAPALDVSEYTAAVSRLRQRWARGNFATPRDLGVRLRAWRTGLRLAA